jgi:DNA-directed RNA polymerase subunit alpha
VAEPTSFLDTDIWSLEWSVRVANALVNLNIRTVRDLMTINKSDLRRMPNFGEKSLREIEDALSRHGLRLD